MWREHVQLALTAVFWGGAFHAAQLSLAIGPPVGVAVLRFSLASGLMLLLLSSLRVSLPRDAGSLVRTARGGLFGIFIYNLLFFEGLRQTSAINGSLIVASNPVITAILLFFWKGERLRRLQLAGALLTFVGVALVILPAEGSAIQANAGDLMILGSTTCWAIYTILGQKLVVNPGPLVSTTLSMVTGTVMLVPFALLEVNYARPLDAQLLWLMNLELWLAVVYMSVFATIIGYLWWYRGVRALGPTATAIYINLVPVTTMAIASLRGESLGLRQLLGSLLVICGVYLTGKKKSTLPA
ncbi:MAG: DMT family transporter [Spirochaetales bacterium]|nr:DMT family transporter [Spirochaetales bacterium]